MKITKSQNQTAPLQNFGSDFSIDGHEYSVATGHVRRTNHNPGACPAGRAAGHLLSPTNRLIADQIRKTTVGDEIGRAVQLAALWYEIRDSKIKHELNVWVRKTGDAEFKKCWDFSE